MYVEMAVKLSKKMKATQTKKNAEALKAKKKATRTSNGPAAPTGKPGQKSKSVIGQAKKKK
jgi:hypothetical protein